jgi:hypothetical protein
MAVEGIFPALLLEPASAFAWTTAFCQYAVVHHAFSFAIALHRDLFTGRFLRTRKADMLEHKTMAIQLLNRLLSSQMDGPMLEMALLVISVLAQSDFNEHEIEKAYAGHLLPFDPPLPPPLELRVFARLDCVPAHGQAMVVMINKAGGLANLQTPGLAEYVSQ